MAKTRRLTSKERRAEVLSQMNKEQSAIVREVTGSPLIGLMLQTQALLVLYERLQQGDVQFSLDIRAMEQVIEFELSGTVNRLMSILEEMKTLTYGLTALRLTTQLEIDVLLDGVSTMKADLTQIYSED